jgi:hypothetical protein
MHGVMKKSFLIIIISGLLISICPAQKLLDIYKKGPVKLVPDKSYGANNNWESLFNRYYDTLNISEGEREQYKKIILGQDGSVFMSHKNRYEIWKFGPNGNFNKKFGSKGGKPGQFAMLPEVKSIVDGKYILTSDVNARLNLFDLEGKYFKSLKLDYMTGPFQSLGNGDLLLEGTVMFKNQESGGKYTSYKWRHIIVNLNIYSGKTKIVYEVMEDADYKYPNTKNKDSLAPVQIPTPGNKIYVPHYMFFRQPVFTLLNDGRFILSARGTGDVKIFSKNGREISAFKLAITPLNITEKDVQERYENLKKGLEEALERIRSTPWAKGDYKKQSIDGIQQSLKNSDRYKDIKNYYPQLPYFSNIILDDEGNFLVFEFTYSEEKESNKFNVIAYDNAGKILAKTSFICDDYKLNFSENTFIISKGYVYALAELKNHKGMPLRLIRFKMTN